MVHMEMQEIFQSIVEHASVRTIYGDPISAEGKTVVPVAKISYGFGGGSGRDEQRGSGGGGGGGCVAKPVGVVEITDAGTRFIPIGGVGRIALAFMAGLCLGLLLRSKPVNGG